MRTLISLLLVTFLTSQSSFATLTDTVGNQSIRTRAALSYFDEFSSTIDRLRANQTVTRMPDEILLEAQMLGFTRADIENAALANNRISAKDLFALNGAQKASIIMSCAAIALSVLNLLHSCAIN